VRWGMRHLRVLALDGPDRLGRRRSRLLLSAIAPKHCVTERMPQVKRTIRYRIPIHKTPHKTHHSTVTGSTPHAYPHLHNALDMFMCSTAAVAGPAICTDHAESSSLETRSIPSEMARAMSLDTRRTRCRVDSNRAMSLDTRRTRCRVDSNRTGGSSSPSGGASSGGRAGGGAGDEAASGGFGGG